MLQLCSGVGRGDRRAKLAPRQKEGCASQAPIDVLLAMSATADGCDSAGRGHCELRACFASSAASSSGVCESGVPTGSDHCRSDY